MIRVFSVVIMCAILGGCATIISSKQQIVSINSNVSGADIYLVIDKKETLVGKTPFNNRIQRSNNAVLRVKKDGYQTLEQPMESSVNMVFLINILSGGTTGTSTDYSTGALYQYSPNSFMINLVPQNLSKNASLKFQKESIVRHFSIMNYDRLNSDISRGNGEYLDCIYSFAGARDEAQKTIVLRNIRNIQANSATIPEFGNRIATQL